MAEADDFTRKLSWLNFVATDGWLTHCLRAAHDKKASADVEQVEEWELAVFCESITLTAFIMLKKHDCSIESPHGNISNTHASQYCNAQQKCFAHLFQGLAQVHSKPQACLLPVFCFCAASALPEQTDICPKHSLN